MTQDILKPCPFCEGIAEIGETEDHLGQIYPAVRCVSCFAEVARDTETEAIAAWNTRPSPSDGRIDEIVERLRATKTSGVPTFGAPTLYQELVNPDGPVAAALIEQQAARIADAERIITALRRLLLPARMMLAQAECVDEPMADEDVIMHFMGSGASDQVTAGEFREADRAASLWLEGNSRDPG